MEIEVAEDKINAIEEEEEEVVEEEEVEEEVEEVEEEEGGGEGEGEEGGESVEKGVDNVDSAGEEIKQSDHDSGSSSSSGKIFVGGVAWETTEDTFANHFKKYGEITDSVIMMDKHTQMPRGFGFITFADPSVIDKVLADEHVLDGRTVEVKRTVPREDMASKGGVKTKKIFVGGIPTSLTEDEFKEHFASFGKVVEHQIMVDHSTGRSRGFGFITFEDEETVEKIIAKGKMLDLAGKQVEIKKAEPKKAGDTGFGGRAYGGGRGNARGMSGAGAYRYGGGGGGGGYRSGGGYYGGSGGDGYGRGYVYGGNPGYGTGFGPNLGGSMYAGGYVAGNGYGGPGGYGGAYGYGTGRGFGSRYHPYGR